MVEQLETKHFLEKTEEKGNLLCYTGYRHIRGFCAVAFYKIYRNRCSLTKKIQDWQRN